jgi:hypothetical protein
LHRGGDASHKHAGSGLILNRDCRCRLLHLLLLLLRGRPLLLRGRRLLLWGRRLLLL